MKIQAALTAKNEEESVGYMIYEIRKIGINDIFVVDENSEDQTAAIAEKAGVPVYQRAGVGKGFGTKKAVELSHSQNVDLLVLPDCDCTYPPREVPRFLKYFPEYDMVVGVREYSRIVFLHRLANLIINTTFNIMFRTNLTDILSGMRVIKVKSFEGRLEGCGFDIETQITARAAKMGLKIKEVPIKYEERRGESKIQLSDAFLIMFRMLKERVT